MYRCLDCGWDFDEPHNYREYTGVTADGGFREIVHLSVCPVCNGSNYKHLVTCSTCGAVYIAGEGCRICRNTVRGKFRMFVSSLDPHERNMLNDLLDGKSVEEV